jgi:hypothetical protein
MAGGNEVTNGGRVTTRELYNALQEQNKDRADMEQRLSDKIENIGNMVSRNDERIKRNKEEIDFLRTKSTRDDWISGISAAIVGAAAAIATVLGVKQQ